MKGGEILLASAICIEQAALLTSPGFTTEQKRQSPLFRIGGRTYYRFNFHNAKDSGYTNNYTSFTNSQNSFELGMASIKAADYSIGKVDGVVDLGFGRKRLMSFHNDGDLDQNKNGFISLC